MRRGILKLGYKLLNSKYLSKIFSSYKLTWEMAAVTRSTAVDAVLFNVKDEEEFWERGEEDAQKLRKFVDKNSVVLDVGCGLGRVEKFLAPYCKEIHAIDISARMLRLAKNNLKDHANVFLHKNNGKDLSLFSDNKFDFVFSIITLQHLEKEDAYVYIKEIHRVLKRGGKAQMQIPNFLSDEVFKWFVGYANKGSKHIARVRGYTEPEVEKMLHFVGFQKLELNSEGDDIIAVASK